MFVFEFSSTHANGALLRLTYLGIVWSPRLGKQKSVPFAVFNLMNLSSVLSLEFSDFVFFCSTTKVTFFIFRFTLRIVLFGAAAACVIDFDLTFRFYSCSCFAVASFICFFAAALHLLWLIDHCFSASHALWNVSVNETESLSASAFSIGLVFLLVFVESFSFVTTRSPLLMWRRNAPK